jgi:hypothetical protein
MRSIARIVLVVVFLGGIVAALALWSDSPAASVIAAVAALGALVFAFSLKERDDDVGPTAGAAGGVSG